MAWEIVIAAALALIGSLAGSILANRRSTSLIAYRLERVEQEVSRYNDLLDRVHCVEKRVSVVERDVSAAHARIKSLEEKR